MIREQSLALLTATDLTCEKGDRQLFSQLSFSLASHTLLYVTGENGAGKTSLLRILVGLSQASQGSVEINQSHEPIFIGHKSAINSTLSAFENMQYWARLHDIDVSESKILSVLHTLGLEFLEHIPSTQLSAGQQRRVALAKLWLDAPSRLWVMDEPYTALDVDTIALLQQHIAAFVNQGGSVIMTSHQQPSIDCSMHTLHLEYQW